jgi:hypothetical protein
MTPNEAAAAGVPGYYVVELEHGRAVGGPFAVDLMARNVRLALEAALAGRFVVELVEAPAEVPA